MSIWRSNFKLIDTPDRTTLVWIRVPSIPLKMFDDNSLLEVGNGVENMVMGPNAPICVELNMNPRLMPTVVMQEKNIKGYIAFISK